MIWITFIFYIGNEKLIFKVFLGKIDSDGFIFRQTFDRISNKFNININV